MVMTDEHKANAIKWLRRKCEIEGINFNNVNAVLHSMFENLDIPYSTELLDSALTTQAILADRLEIEDFESKHNGTFTKNE